ncbi:MAG: tRNA (adenosine(37)-N6)-dimethylallyltransferase MiaA [Microgenomates group bacterium]
MSPKSRVLIIAGPTASGKTALALRLAEVSTKAGRRPTSIISADSRQVYAGLDVLTGKDIPPGFSKKNDYYTNGVIRLWGLDLIRPDQVMTAAGYSDYARSVIATETKENRQVIVVGGTGFYLKALTQPASLAKVAPDEKLRQKLNRLSVAELKQKLKAIDPERLDSMNQSDAANPRRLIRAIEVAVSTPAPVIPANAGIYSNRSPIESGMTTFSWVGLRLPLTEIKARITARVTARFDRSVEEVQALLTACPDRSLPIYSSLGVGAVLKYLSGEITAPAAETLWAAEEFQYAKRQLTWFKKQPSIIWYDQEEVSKLSLDKLI